jgi:hypothetical protein
MLYASRNGFLCPKPLLLKTLLDQLVFLHEFVASFLWLNVLPNANMWTQRQAALRTVSTDLLNPYRSSLRAGFATTSLIPRVYHPEQHSYHVDPHDPSVHEGYSSIELGMLLTIQRRRSTIFRLQMSAHMDLLSSRCVYVYGSGG